MTITDYIWKRTKPRSTVYVNVLPQLGLDLGTLGRALFYHIPVKSLGPKSILNYNNLTAGNFHNISFKVEVRIEALHNYLGHTSATLGQPQTPQQGTL
jgi:hypothetical protein